jgi:hypothetical protein
MRRVAWLLATTVLLVPGLTACQGAGAADTPGATTSGGPAPGGVFVTGHDPDFHAFDPDHVHNETGARNILQRAVTYVTSGIAAPSMLLITDRRNPGGDQSDPQIGLNAAGFHAFTMADDGFSGEPGVLDLHTVDLTQYQVVVVASDNGGWLRQDELDILNARAADIRRYVQRGGGLVVLNESDLRAHAGVVNFGTTADRYRFVPFPITGIQFTENEIGVTVTPAGVALGLTDSDVNGNAFHSMFTATGGLDAIDKDSDGHVLSLAIRGIQPPALPGCSG